MKAGSLAARAVRRAQAASRYARQAGCDIGEASSLLADRAAIPVPGERAAPAEPGGGLSRRQVLRGAATAGLAVAVPAGVTWPRDARAAVRPGARVVIIASGIAGLGCAFRLWARHGVASEVYEYNPARAGGRIDTLRGFFAEGQYAEEHGEFISSEHTQMRRLASGFGLTLDDVNAYPPHTRAGDYRFHFGGRFWPQAALDREWHDWGWRLFHEAAFVKAPWPTLLGRHTAQARRWDHTPAAEWIEERIPGGLGSDFGRLCVAILLDEYGGPVADQSALNLIYLLGTYDSVPSGRQPRSQPQLRAIREEPLGTNAKIALQFSRRVWNADHWTGNLYTDAVVQGGWETTVHQPGDAGILIALPGGEAGADLGRRYGLSSYEGAAPGPMARDFLACFDQNFPGARDAYNGRAYYAWSAGDPHIGGAYSYLKTGQYTAFNGIQGRRSGNLHFAGEHTSVNFQGYMEGALRSGYRCAAEIAGRAPA